MPDERTTGLEVTGHINGGAESLLSSLQDNFSSLDGGSENGGGVQQRPPSQLSGIFGKCQEKSGSPTPGSGTISLPSVLTRP
jgi:hypothetical protein